MKTTLSILAGALALGLITSGPAAATSLAPALAKSGPGFTEITYGYKVPLHRIYRTLQHRGFWNVRMVDNHGRLYGFVASGNRGLYKISVSAYTGDIVSVDRIHFRGNRGHRRAWY
jgi:hypothetical protein